MYMESCMGAGACIYMQERVVVDLVIIPRTVLYLEIR